MRDPDQKSPFARAWNLDLSKVPEGPAKESAVVSWLLNVPGAHPFWAYWVLSIISLRDIPGVKPAYKRYPEAEYEFMILAVDPERHPAPDPDVILIEGLGWLDPIDVVEQFHGISEIDCRRLAEGSVRAICSGQVSPDQDYRPAWKNLIEGTVRHLAEGRHPLH